MEDTRVNDRARPLQHWADALACIERSLACLHAGQANEDDARDPAAALAATLGDEPCAAWLCEVFGLDELDLALVAIAVAPEIDRRFGRLYALLQDDPRPAGVGTELCLALLASSLGGRLEVSQRLAAGAPLVRHRVLEIDRSAVRPDPQVLSFLLQRDVLDARLGSACRMSGEGAALEDVPLAAAERARVAAAPVAACVYLRTDDDDQARRTAAALARRAGARVLECDLRAVLRAPDPAALLALIFREAWLRTLFVHLRHVQRLAEDEAFAARDALRLELAQAACGCALSGDADWPALELDAPVLVLDGRGLDAGERAAQWRRCAREAGLALDEATLASTAQRFRLRPTQIARAATCAAQALGAAGAAADARDALFAAAREQSGRRLATLATRIRPRRGWDDLVLPPDSLAQLREVCARVARRDLVLQSWGFERRLSQGFGTAVLFAGPSGTGKTMTAEIVAGELGLDLYRIDLATIVSKYVGETEKNLDRVFEAAQEADAVLLFDEAEALFGKRSEVRDAHDRYANIEVAYLLQRMEAFPGLAILSTNMRQNLDEAFTRRIAFTVHFPFPEVAQRRRIWAGMWPRETPLAADVDFDLLASRFALSGGHIKNVALAAAFLAADDGGVVGMRHLLHGARREFQKQGKSLHIADTYGPGEQEAA
jgi:hypothetical protein